MDFLETPIEDNFVFAQMSPSVILHIANKLKPKNSCGPDNISTNLLKQILPIIIKPVCYLFNLSLQTGYIPAELKTAKVIGTEHPKFL